MLTAYTAVLASPGFVFVEEKPGRLDDTALATRLSLFLWNSIPDDTLRALADRGELHQPEVLRAQTERLLDDPKCPPLRRGVHRLLARPAEDRRHLAVHHALQRLRAGRPAQAGRPRGDAALLRRAAARRSAGAQHRRLRLHVPERAAGRPLRHPAASRASHLRRVTLPPDSVRGGLMTQASVLKVTANGTTTSPVLRGHWITERILGLRDAAAAAGGRGRRAGHSRRGDDPPAARKAPRQTRAARPATARWTRRASRWRAST